MINIANISSYGSNLYENFYQLVRKTGISQKTCDVVKGVFKYCNRHHNALQAFTWYCLFIEVGSLTFQTTYDNLDTCQDLVCHLWNTTNETRHLFSPHTEFRCNPSNSNYQPFYFLKECLSNLCEYTKQVDLNFAACISYNNSVSKEDSKFNLDLTYELWDKLCPKKHFRHPNLIKEASYINSCIASLCNYFNTFEVTVESDLSEMCKHANTLKLNDLLDRLSKLIHNSEKKLEEDDSWTRANTVTSIIASVATIAVSAIATITTVITYRLTKPNVPATDTVSVINGLRNVMHGVVETTRALGNVNLQTAHLAAETNAMNNLISEVRNLVSEVSEVVEHSFSYHEGNMIRGNEGGIDLSLEASGINTEIQGGTIGIKASGKIDSVLSKSGSILNIILSSSGKTFKIIKNSSEIEKQSTASVLLDESSSTVQEKINDTKRYVEHFINDIASYSFTGFNITAAQVDRIKEYLEGWQNAICHFEKKLFCRLPLPVHDIQPMIFIPDHYIEYIISEDLSGLCYYLLHNLWCNWSKFVELVSGTTYSVDNNTNCPWDYLTLNIQQNMEDLTEYKMQAIGNCYNQTILLKV